MTQFNLEDFDEDGVKEDAVSEKTIRRARLAYAWMPDNAEPNNRYSCPYCCAPPRDFRVGMRGVTACGNCGSGIPIEQDWYHEGHKMIF